MSNKREVRHVWTCDACGHEETIDDSGSGRPSGWGQIVHGRLHDKIGNLPEQHLCPDCRDNLIRLAVQKVMQSGECGSVLGGMLKRAIAEIVAAHVTAAKAEAWDEGATAVWQPLAAGAWSLEFYLDDNPYRDEAPR